jgi:hypothetical protein
VFVRPTGFHFYKDQRIGASHSAAQDSRVRSVK